ncbi:MAG TPA: class I SAM-dependent methyltransferase [Pararhizobium sp.]|nr:class I SAM-dependent methyltransferase [Pararhizobium sp.]
MPESDKHEWLKRGSVESGEVRAYYDDLAASYDRQLDDWHYRAPDEAAAMLKACTPPDASIFDAGCGTGLTGAALKAAGFTGPIDGGDLSSKSVALAKARGVYRSVSVMNFQEMPLPVAEKAYDAAICVGVLTYIPDAGRLMRDFCRLVKPGGAVLFTHREDLFRSQDYEPMLAGLEAEGLWTRLTVTEPQPYLPCNPDFAEEIGVVFGLFRVGG